MGNPFRSKSNKVVREFLDKLFANWPEDELIKTDCICSKINEADHRRWYANNRVASLLRERDDIEKTPGGWKKKKEGGIQHGIGTEEATA